MCLSTPFTTKPKKTAEEVARLAAGYPRYSKKSRLRKKFAKKHQEKYRACLLQALIIEGIRRPRGFICETCGRYNGFYQTMATNMFKIKPLPQGALPTYDRDFNVADIIVEEHKD